MIQSNLTGTQDTFSGSAHGLCYCLTLSHKRPFCFWLLLLKECPTESQIVPMSHDSNHAEPLEVQPS